MAISNRPARGRAGRLALPVLVAVLLLGVLAVSKWEWAWMSQGAAAQQKVGSSSVPACRRHCRRRCQQVPLAALLVR